MSEIITLFGGYAKYFLASLSGILTVYLFFKKIRLEEENENLKNTINLKQISDDKNNLEISQRVTDIQTKAIQVALDENSKHITRDDVTKLMRDNKL